MTSPQRQSNHRPRSLRRLGKSVLAVGAILLALLLGEGLVRTLGSAPPVKAIALGTEDCVYRRSTNPILGFELKANYRHERPDFIQSYERTNAHGLRDKERELPKPPSVQRIILLGDSVVEGYGLPEDATISSQWEKSCEDGKTEVLNFGISAYCTRAEVELLEIKGLAFDPDVVVLLFVENDFDNFNREAFPLGGTVDRPKFAEAMFLHSHLFRLAALQGNWFHFRAERDPIPWNQSAIGDNNVHDGLQRLAELAKEHHFQAWVAIWPRFTDGAITDVHLLPGKKEELIIERLAAMHRLPSFRLSPFFRKDLANRGPGTNPRLVYSSGDGLHPSSVGSQVAAQALQFMVMDGPADHIFPSTKGIDQETLRMAGELGKDRPHYGRVHHRLGMEAFKAGKTAEAIDHFHGALKADSQDAGVYHNLGLAYERLGRSDASAQFAKAVELRPEFTAARYHLARSLFKAGQPDGAIAELKQTVQSDPRHAAALNLLGVELGKRREFAEALSYLEMAVEADPTHSESHNNLGVVQAASGNLSEAIASFQRAVEADPQNQRAVANLKRLQSQNQPTR